MTDREKLIELIRHAIDTWEHGERVDGRIADHLLANGVTVAKDTNVPNKWIPVTERLPEDCAEVLGCAIYRPTGFSYQVVLTYHSCLEAFHKYDFCGVKHGGFVDYDSESGYFVRSDITHWMPLPEPPKEDA